MIDIGGDIRVAGTILAKIAIADPQRDAIGASTSASIELNEGAIATSGGSERGFDVAGTKHSHLLDPRTGRPATEVVSSTVIAPEAATADVLATICSVLPMAEGLKLVESIPGAKCLLVSSAGIVMMSANWPDDGAVAKQDDEEATAKEPSFLVEFEIKKAENSGRYLSICRCSVPLRSCFSVSLD